MSIECCGGGCGQDHCPTIWIEGFDGQGFMEISVPVKELNTQLAQQGYTPTIKSASLKHPTDDLI